MSDNTKRILRIEEAPMSILLQLVEDFMGNLPDQRSPGSSVEYIFSAEELAELREACDKASHAISLGFNKSLVEELHGMPLSVEVLPGITLNFK